MKWLLIALFVAAYTAHASAVEVVAHRGESADAPENTMASFRLAWERGDDAIELDVHLTKDGQLIVCHDPDTKRHVRSVVGTVAAAATRVDLSRGAEPRPLQESAPDSGREHGETACRPVDVRMEDDDGGRHQQNRTRNRRHPGTSDEGGRGRR